MEFILAYLLVAFIWTCLFGTIYGSLDLEENELYPHQELNMGSTQYILLTGIMWPLSIAVTIYLVIASFGDKNI